MGELLDDDFREFGASGKVWTKPEILSSLEGEAPKRITMAQFCVQPVSREAALVTYRATVTQDEGAPVESLRSSLWAFKEARWRMLFHQGTLAG